MNELVFGAIIATLSVYAFMIGMLGDQAIPRPLRKLALVIFLRLRSSVEWVGRRLGADW